MDAQEKHGRRWNIISGYLTGRPAVHCRNRWLSLLRAGRITDGIQKAAATFDTSTLHPVAPGSFISPAPSPTPSQGSSGFESGLESLFNNWETQPTLSSQESTENYTEGLPIGYGHFNTGNSQHVSHGHHRSASSSSTLSWTSSTEFGVAPLLEQVSYNQGTMSPELMTTAISNGSRMGSPSQLEPLHTITLTPPLQTQTESLIMTCSHPYCPFQSTNLTEIWRHMTWDHIGNKTHCPPEMSALVERVVIDSGSTSQ